MSQDPRVGGSQRELFSGGPRQIVRSAEQVHLELPLAGPTSRILAYAIDFLVILVLQVGLLMLVIFVAAAIPFMSEWLSNLGDRSADLASADPEKAGAVVVLFLALFMLFQLVAEWGYFVLCEMATGGRSLGKAVVGLRVVSDGGGALTLRASLARNLLRIADVLPSSYLAGLVTMIVSPEGKRLGDIVAGTVVIRLDAAPVVKPVRPTQNLDPAEFRFDRSDLEKLGPGERTLLRQTLRRLDDLTPDRAEEALDRACAVFCERLAQEAIPASRRRAFLESLWAASEAAR